MTISHNINKGYLFNQIKIYWFDEGGTGIGSFGS